MNIAQWIPGTTSSAIRGLNNAVEGTTASVHGAVFGSMMSKTVGGALAGGIGNAAIYSQSGQGMGGATNYGEAIMGGAGVGAVAGAALGVMGAKSVMATARGRISKNKQQMTKAAEKVLKRADGLENNLQVMKNSENVRQGFVSAGSLTPQQAKIETRADRDFAFSGFGGLSKKARKQLKTTVYSRPVNP